MLILLGLPGRQAGVDMPFISVHGAVLGRLFVCATDPIPFLDQRTLEILPSISFGQGATHELISSMLRPAH
ncbi:MAG: hypothetical protein AAF597_18005 [Bacteroidota bacterium]